MKDESFGIVPIFKQEDTYLFLLIQHHAGHWGFPKGHANPGESAIESASREFEEETGIRDYTLVDESCFLESYNFLKEEQSIEKTVMYFLAIVQSKAVQLQEEEVQNHAWEPFNDALNLITFNGNKQVLMEVQRYLEKTVDSDQ